MAYGLRERLSSIKSRDYCGRGAIVRVLDQGRRVEVVPMMCKTWGCPRCGPRLGRAWVASISSQKIERFITLTCEHKKFVSPLHAAREMKDAWGILVRRIRKKFGKFEYVGIWELHKSGWPHFHIACKGTYIPQKWMSLQWKTLGIGYIVWISKVSSARRCARYVGKYLLKGARRTWEALPRMRLVQVSGGFCDAEDGKAPRTADPGSVAVYCPAGFGEVIEYLVLDVGLLLASEDDYGRVELRAPPEGIRRQAKEGWQYKILSVLSGGECDVSGRQGKPIVREVSKVPRQEVLRE